jgi:hypothetical protein
MKAIKSKLTLSVAAVAAALLFAPGSGVSGTLGSAAAPIGPQTSLDTDAGTAILAKDKGPGNFKCCGNGPGPKPPIGPGDFKPGGGGGGGGGKGGGGKSGGWNHHHGWGAAVGGAIILGMGYCAAQSERCEDEYGDGTSRYWRCMRRAGCSD